MPRLQTATLTLVVSEIFHPLLWLPQITHAHSHTRVDDVIISTWLRHPHTYTHSLTQIRPKFWVDDHLITAAFVYIACVCAAAAAAADSAVVVAAVFKWVVKHTHNRTAAAETGVVWINIIFVSCSRTWWGLLVMTLVQPPLLLLPMLLLSIATSEKIDESSPANSPLKLLCRDAGWEITGFVIAAPKSRKLALA